MLIRNFAGIFALSACLAIPAFAAGDGGSSSGSSPASEKSEEQKCKETEGKVWNNRTNKCVNSDDAMLDGESIYETGRHLAMIGRYDDAIVLLTPISHEGDKRVLTYLGYAWRKAGHVDLALTYYNQAVAIDPAYAQVREYLGEALIKKGDVGGARAQLQQIASICGVTCVPYLQLQAEISKAGI